MSSDSHLQQPLQNISDTAYLVAAYRAMETSRDDSLFKDPYAMELVGQHGMAIVNSLRSGKNSSWFLVARTCILDNWIQKIIQNEKIDTVLNLAAGLDTRAYRLQLPPQLRWFDIDLPDILSHKEKVLQHQKPSCQFKFVKMDLSHKSERSQFFSEVATDSKKTLIISEGFLMYLNPSTAGALAVELAQYPPFKFWLAELLGPFQLKLINWKWGKQFKSANCQMGFAPLEGADFFIEYGWTPIAFRSSFDEAIRLGRAPRGSSLFRKILKVFPSFLVNRLNRAGIALLVR
jgi:methyltransferase (TIGR00027 family)